MTRRWGSWVALGAVLVGCADPRSAPRPSPSGADTAAPEPSSPATEPPVFLEPPSLAANTLGAGLTVWLTVRTDRPTTLEIAVTDPVRARRWTVDAPATDHRVLVTGLQPDADHAVEVTARDARGEVRSEPVAWRSRGLPEGAPAWTVRGDPALAEPGVTLLVAAGTIWMVDAAGEVAWYAPAPAQVHQIGLTPRGTLLFQVGRDSIEEIALSGEAIRAFRTTRATRPADAVVVPEEAFHHDVVELPDGNLLTLGIEDRVFRDYPSSEDNPRRTERRAPVAGDVVLELDPQGAVVARWPLLDALDPYRIGRDSLKGRYWDLFFEEDWPHVNDWSHGNALAYDPARDEIVVSLRHQDAVVALERATGALSWIFAPTANWRPAYLDRVLTPERPTDRPAYHQHAARVLPNGHLLMFDNGNERASAFEEGLAAPDRWSRCLEVAIDPVAGTWTTVWEWGGDLPESHYAGSLGDCDALPLTGNRLITFGNLANPALPGVRIVEVDPAGREVWSLDLGTPDERLTLFRSERLTGVIPGR